jgi:hypothetical protein
LAFLFGTLLFLNTHQLAAQESLIAALESARQATTDQVIVVHIGERGLGSIQQDLDDLKQMVSQSKQLKSQFSRKIVAAVHIQDERVEQTLVTLMSQASLAVVDVPNEMKNAETGLISYEAILSEVPPTYYAVHAFLNGNAAASFELITVSKTPHLYTMSPKLEAIWTVITQLGRFWTVLAPGHLKTILDAARLADENA